MQSSWRYLLALIIERNGAWAHMMSLKMRCNTHGNLHYPPSWCMCFLVAGTSGRSFWMFLWQLIPWRIPVVPNSLLSRISQIRWAVLTSSLRWPVLPCLKPWTLDIGQSLRVRAYMFLAKCDLFMTCPSGMAKHSPLYAELGKKKSVKLDMKQDFLLIKVLRLLVVTLKMDK